MIDGNGCRGKSAGLLEKSAIDGGVANEKVGLRVGLSHI